MKPTLQGDGLCREGMNGEVVWTEEEGYVGTTGRGKRFGIYGTDTPSPMEMVLHGHAACSLIDVCLLYTSPSPRDLSTSRMPSSA